MNPIVKKLGYSDTDRLVIIHADDIGMCQASVQAFKDLWEFGAISSGAVMVPCSWFPAIAEMCRKNPGMDMGVHATLNAEWENYRWGPVSTRDQTSGLMDADGYFHQWQQAVYQNAKPEAVATEVNAQIERALAAGIDVTHVDSHMGTIMNPLFIQSYIQSAASHLLPNMLPRTSANGIEMMGISEEEFRTYAPIINQLESQGIPMLDGLFSMPLEHADDHMGVAKKMLGEVPVGISHFILHPSVDTPELRAICPDWPARAANFNAFMSKELKDFINNTDLKLIGYRQIRNAMRGLNDR
jgi:predicted glycoside hydrolase/deacetylase ChbG (UPF0249 family)